jgi:hypothetical protein
MIIMDAALEPIEEVTRRVDSDYRFFPGDAGETLETRLILLTADYVLWEVAARFSRDTHATLEAFREQYGTRLVVSDGNDAQEVLAQLQTYIDGRRQGL